MKKAIIISIISSLVTTLVTIWVFNNYIIPPIALEQRKYVVKNASDILWAEDFSRVFQSSAPTDFIDAARKGTKSVVFVESEIKIENDNAFTRRVTRETGSGVIIRSDGYIVTNSHVVDEARKITITLENKAQYDARLIAEDKQTDIALLKIEADNLPTLVAGNSDALRIGEWVIAVGNPFRLQSSVTAGIVSAKGRNINVLDETGIESFIQTDAAINSGNSGGALINTAGELVGISTAMLTSSGSYQGFSFAIPINLARKVVQDMIEYGAVQRAWLGVIIEDIDAGEAERSELPEIKGVKIVTTAHEGAAQDAGLQSGDIIVGIDNNSIKDMPDFVEYLGKKRPGDVVQVKYYRDGQRRILPVTLRNKINSTDLIAVRKDPFLQRLGFELRDLDKNEVKRLGSDGIYVVSVYTDSPIANSNMEPGYIITELNGEPVNNLQSFMDLLENYKGSAEVNGYYEKYEGMFPYTFMIE